MDKELNKLFQDDSEDAILAAIQESLRYFNEVELPRRAAEQKEEEKKNGSSSKESVYFEPQPHCSKKDVCGNTPVTEVFYRAPGQGADGFHLAAGETYVYPTNYPVRQYQKTIIHSALFHNTLVSLPTGLGKTFIAAVVMYNFYRWFPQGKIVFMAPTKPLVAQQIRACHDIMAIPIKDTIEMTGTMNPTDRIQHWINKRAFFLTPQVMANDLRTKACPATAFKCVVIDEAHRATKEYSYCHVIKELEKAGAMFRVLALSATPGSNIKAVVEVVQNLRISTLELRGEDSPDVIPYTHAKQIEPISLSLSKNITDFREQYLLIFERYVKNLRESRFVTCNVQNLTKFQLLKASEKMRSRPPNGINKTKMGIMMSDFTVCMTLAHGLELLQTYGLRAFYHYFTACEDEENRKAAFTRLNSDGDFHSLMNKLQQAVSTPMDQFWSHPKHEKLVHILKDHFCQAEKEDAGTKVIIFCQYRVVVCELYELLQTTHPLIKPVMFVGQAGKDKSGGLPQRKQLEVMKGFRQGLSNVLIATCVAEEGLDIGSVDLLVMMECQRSPVRLVQRLGRTGRHRQGRCVVLLTSGKEVQKFNEAMATRKSFISMIDNSNLLKSKLIKDEPLMVPPQIMPRMQLVHINVPERITPAKKKKQADIRQALISKINDTEEKEPEASPFLDPEQMSQVKNELNTLEMKYDSLHFKKAEYLSHRLYDPPMQPDELFSANVTQQSEYNDWNRVLHQTYLVLHSSDTETLCHLLHKSESMLLNTHADLNSQQVNCSSLIPQKKDTKKGKAKSGNVAKKKKNEKEERHGRDIRECMAQAADKVRLTQNKLVEENTHAEQITNVVESSLQTVQEIVPVVLEISDTISEETSKEIKDLGNEKLEDSNCLFCDKATKFPCYSLLTKKSLSDDLLDLNQIGLKKVESFVKNLTKESVNNISVTNVFGGGSSCTVDNIRNSLLRLKNSLNFSVYEKSRSPLITVDDIFDNKHNMSQSPILDSHPTHNQVIVMQENEPEREHLDVLDQEYFNLEDLFNEEEDVLGFDALAKNTKTSTPKKSLSLNGSLNKTKMIENDRTTAILAISKKQQHNVIEKDVIGVKNNILLKNSELISPILKLNPNSVKPFFKIPQRKLDTSTFSTPKAVISATKLSNSQTPGSPVLSGQVASNLDLNMSPVLSGQVAPNQESFLSPVLSGQVRANENNNISPILSGHVSMPKLEKKVLFQDNFNNKAGNIEASEFCKPLGPTVIHSETDIAEIEALNLLSASQLFDDSSDEDKNKDLEQSSMYTISQMVAKVSALADKIKDSEPVVSNNSPKQTKSSVYFENSDEDSLFEQINLDNFSSEKHGFVSTKKQPNNRSHFNNSFLITNNYLTTSNKSSLNHSLEVEKNEIEKINSLKRSYTSVNTSSGDDSPSKLPTKGFPRKIEESFISSRWLTCMKTPLKTNKSVSFATDSTNLLNDSDSESDVFEDPSHKTQTKVTGKAKPERKTGKSTKQGGKAQFLELEANVSMTGGVQCSSDEENTSGLDELDESFINDMTELPSTSVEQTTTDIQSKYLQSVKSPMRRPGFKIPAMTDSILERDVFSQAVPEDENNSYENDSFCCDASELPLEDEPSELEIAERLLKLKSRKKKKKRKRRKSDTSSGDNRESVSEVLKKRKRKRHKSDTSSGDNRGSVSEVLKKRKRKRRKSNTSSGDNRGSVSEVLKNKRLLSSSSSEEFIEDAKKLKKRKYLSSSDSSPGTMHCMKMHKKNRRVQLLTSSDSDSDKTIL